MNILLWHVHGSWTTSFVAGPDTYLLPVTPDRGPDGRGRARTWTWPDAAREVSPEGLRDRDIDLVVLQRPHELDLVTAWTGRRPGTDIPAVYLEHNAPTGPAASTVHPLARRGDIPLVHVTDFNALMWDSGSAPVLVIEHGIADIGHLYTGREPRLGVVVNEPIRRWRVAGTDILLRIADRVPMEVFGMRVSALAEHAPALAGHLHDDIPQHRMHRMLATTRCYLHPYRWTSLGLSLVEAMVMGMPVLAVAATAAPEAVPREAGAVSADPELLIGTAQRWLADPAEAFETGAAARRYALWRFDLTRFLADWQHLIKEVT